MKSSDSPSSTGVDDAGAGPRWAGDAGLRASAFGGAGWSGFFSGFLPKIEKTKANQRCEITTARAGRSPFYHRPQGAANPEEQMRGVCRKKRARAVTCQARAGRRWVLILTP